MKQTYHVKSVLSFALFTLVILALGFGLLQNWSTASAGYIDKISQEVFLLSGKGGVVYFPRNACVGRCLLNPGTSGAALDPAGDLGRPFSNLMDSFLVKISDVDGNVVGKNIEVCFEYPGDLYVFGLTGQTWVPIQTSLDEVKGEYCALVNAGDLGVNTELSFAYFK